MRFQRKIELFKFPQFRVLGLAFVFSGFYCHNFTEGFFPIFSSSEILIGLPTIISYLVLAVSLFITPLFSNKYGMLIEHKSMVFLSSCLVALGSVLSYLSGTLGANDMYMFVGAVMVGIGSSWMWILWGELYSGFTAEDIDERSSFSFVLMYFAYLLVLIVPTHFSTVFMILSPILAGGLLSLCLQDKSKVGYKRQSKNNEKVLHHEHLRPLIFIAICFFCISLCVAFSWSLLNVLDVNVSKTFFVIAFGGGSLVAIILALVDFEYSRKVDLSELVQYAFPGLILAIVLILLLPHDDLALAFAVICGANVFVDFFAWVLSARTARSMPSYASKIVGWGRFSVQAGFVIGVLLGRLATYMYTQNGATRLQVLASVIAVIAVSSIIAATLLRINTAAHFEEIKSSYVEAAQNPNQVDIDSFIKTYGLTARETDVLNLVYKGLSVIDIQEYLYISKNTVNTHLKHIYKKADVHSREELLALLENKKSL